MVFNCFLTSSWCWREEQISFRWFHNSAEDLGPQFFFQSYSSAHSFVTSWPTTSALCCFFAYFPVWRKNDVSFMIAHTHIIYKYISIDIDSCVIFCVIEDILSRIILSLVTMICYFVMPAWTWRWLPIYLSHFDKRRNYTPFICHTWLNVHSLSHSLIMPEWI